MSPFRLTSLGVLITLMSAQLIPSVAKEIDAVATCMMQQFSRFIQSTHDSKSASANENQLQRSLSSCVSDFDRTATQTNGGGGITSTRPTALGSGTYVSKGVSSVTDGDVALSSNRCPSGSAEVYLTRDTSQCVGDAYVAALGTGEYDIACKNLGVFVAATLVWRCNDPPVYSPEYLECLGASMGLAVTCPYGDAVSREILPGSSESAKLLSASTIVDSAVAAIVSGTTSSGSDTSPTICAAWTVTAPSTLQTSTEAALNFSCGIIDLYYRQSTSPSSSPPSTVSVTASSIVDALANFSGQATYDCAGNAAPVFVSSQCLPTPSSLPLPGQLPTELAQDGFSSAVSALPCVGAGYGLVSSGQALWSLLQQVDDATSNGSSDLTVSKLGQLTIEGGTTNDAAAATLNTVVLANSELSTVEDALDTADQVDSAYECLGFAFFGGTFVTLFTAGAAVVVGAAIAFIQQPAVDFCLEAQSKWTDTQGCQDSLAPVKNSGSYMLQVQSLSPDADTTPLYASEASLCRLQATEQKDGITSSNYSFCDGGASDSPNNVQEYECTPTTTTWYGAHYYPVPFAWVVVDFNGPGTLTVSTPGSTEDTTTAVSGAVLAWTDACGFIQLNYRQSGIAYEQTEPSTCFSQPTDETASDKCTRVSDAGSVEDPFSGESDPLIRYFYGYR